MKKIIFAIIVLALATLACGSSAPQLKTADDFMQEYGGKVEVYTRILIATDCTALQSEFDQAEANLKNQEPGTPQYKWGLGYMDAADQRLKEIGCYGNTNSISPTVDVMLIIKQTADAALIQTQRASSPTPHVTSTNLPTLTLAATLAVIDTEPDPEKCNIQYCQFSSAFKSYIYTEDWVKFLCEKIRNPDEFERIKNYH